MMKKEGTGRGLKSIVFVAVIAAVLAGIAVIVAGIAVIAGIEQAIVSGDEIVSGNDEEEAGKTEEELLVETLDREMEQIVFEQTVSFQDEVLERAVRDQLGQEGPLSKNQIANMRELRIVVDGVEEGLQLSKADLAMFSGLECLCIEVDYSADSTVRCLGFSKDGISGYDNLKLLPNLRELIVYDARLRDIGVLKGIKGLNRLGLRCTANDISLLKEMKDLEWVELEGMYISDISPLLCLDKLDYLSLSYSKFEHEEILGNLSQLEFLYLEGCDLESISFVGSMTNLRRLELASNQLECIDAVYELPNLNILNVKNNPLKSVYPEQMNDLTVLWCDEEDVCGVDSIENVPILEIREEEASLLYRFQHVSDALGVFDPAEEWGEGHRAEAVSEYLGDFDGDGIEDLCLIVTDQRELTNEDGRSWDEINGRWLYVYPGNGTSYDRPLKPLELKYDSGELSFENYHYGAPLMGDGKILLQENAGDTRITYEYCYQNDEWVCIRQDELVGYGNYFYGNYDYYVRDYENNTAEQYAVLFEAPGFTTVKLAENDEDADAQILAGVSVAKDDNPVQYNAYWAMDQVLEENFRGLEAEKVYHEKNDYSGNLERLDGIVHPEYDYLVYIGNTEYRIAFDSYDACTDICKIAVYKTYGGEEGLGSKTIYEYDLGKARHDGENTKLIQDFSDASDIMEYECVQRALEVYDPTDRGKKGTVTEVHVGGKAKDGSRLFCLVVENPDAWDYSAPCQRMLYAYTIEETEFVSVAKPIELKWDREADIREEVFIEGQTVYLEYQTRDETGDDYRTRCFRYRSGQWVSDYLQEHSYYTGYAGYGLFLSSDYLWNRDALEISLDFNGGEKRNRLWGEETGVQFAYDTKSDYVGADAPLVNNIYPDIPDFRRMYATYETVREQEVCAQEALDIVAERLFDGEAEKCAYQRNAFCSWEKLTGIAMPDYYYTRKGETGESILKYCKESKDGYIFAYVRNGRTDYYEYNIKEESVYRLREENTNAK